MILSGSILKRYSGLSGAELVAPHPSLIDPVEQLRSGLLAVVLLATFLFGGVMVAADISSLISNVRPMAFDDWISVSALVVIAVTYVCNKAGYFTIASLGIVLFILLAVVIVSMNELDKMVLSDAQLLEVYEDQGVTVERGFRFLKDPLFYAESLYLKKPERIMALLMVMTLSLLMYSLAEMRIREALAESGRHIWDQKNRPTLRPTIRWILMIFEAICSTGGQDRSYTVAL